MINKKRSGAGIMSEIFVGIAVLSILLYISSPIMNTFSQLINNAKVVADTSTISSDIIRYKNATSNYPTSLSKLEEDKGKYKAGNKIPNDPWGNAYFYKYTSNSFSVWSGGENQANDSGDGSQRFGDDYGITSK